MARDDHAAILQGVKDLIAMLQGHCWVLAQSQRLYGSAGLPDLYCVVPWVGAPDFPGDQEKQQTNSYRAFWVEVKTERDKLRPEQAEFKEKSDLAGVAVVVGRASDVAKFLGLK